MKSPYFVRLIKQMVAKSGRFHCDSLDVKYVKTYGKKSGFDGVIYIVGKNLDESFILQVKKI